MTIIVAYLILKCKLYKIAFWFGTSVLVGAYFLNTTLKNFFERPRPFQAINVNNLTNANGYSFPSGHSMGSIIVYLLLAYLISFKLKRNLSKTIIIISSIILSIVIAFSRVYLGVHYPTDIIAGFLIGLGCALISIFIFKHLKLERYIL